MNKDLPKVFAGKIEEDLKNTQEIYYSNMSERAVTHKEDNLSIESKINRIFKSPNYVYKKEVMIITSKGQEKKVIIGQTSDRLLTMDNSSIPIADIIDIKVL